MAWSWSFYKTLNALILVLALSGYLTIIAVGGAYHKTRNDFKYKIDEDGKFTYNKEYFWMVLFTSIMHVVGILMLPNNGFLIASMFMLVLVTARLIKEGKEMKRGPYYSNEKNWLNNSLIYIDVGSIILTIIHLHLMIQFTFGRVQGVLNV